MSTDLNKLKLWLTALNFIEDKNEQHWIFKNSGGYAITVEINDKNPESSTISFGQKIKIGNKGGLNFKRPENFVVLDCVTRLLEKGYPPENIELEKTWPSGHGTSGRLDIFIMKGKGVDKKSFAMIECKQWGGEYSKERGELLKDGGQLFSYAIQETTTQYLALFASTITDDGKLKTVVEQVHYAPLKGSNQEERHTSWDRSFQLGGILSDSAGPYLSPEQNLKFGELIELDQETGQGLFNSFAEILRRHAISDKSNAFNKIFNLFVCKICDEDYTTANNEYDFQWKIVDTPKNLIEDRLTRLYIKGLKEYLNIDIDESFFSPLAEFSFIDTYDQKSYERNASVIREVIELLQPYQIKYTQKHQFLGDFFEDLLNSGIKQEAGQFFTPTLVARFFLKSIPIHKFIDNQIAEGNSDVLPHVIDFSCGAGHFLTEAIDEIQDKINLIDPSTLVGRHQKRFLAIKDNFYWAKDYIYGIEKDYRLAKTTKIAMFLYGDGDAVIVNGDGLDDFYTSKTFSGDLKSLEPAKSIEKFDVIVSNPPFSIGGFKADVQNIDGNFSLSDSLTLSSSEIECLFIERSSQLLKQGGYLGLILPLSILNNDHRIYQQARKLLLIQFEITALVELRDKTFKPTNTTTCGIFARKRSHRELFDAAISICKCVLNKDVVSDNVTQAIQLSLEMGVDNAQLAKQSSEIYLQLKDSEELQIDCIALPEEFAFTLSSLLNGHQVALIFTGDKKEQEAFLGYRYSKARGRESVEILRLPDGSLMSGLYDETKLDNPEKANAHILAAFAHAPLPIPNELASNVRYCKLNDLVAFKSFEIENPSNQFVTETGNIESNSPFGDFINDFKQQKIDWDKLLKSSEIQHIPGLVYSKKSETPKVTSKRVLTASNLDLSTGLLVLTNKLVYLDDSYELPEALCPKKGDILISKASGSLRHLGKAIYIREDLKDYAVGGFLMILRCSDERLAKALHYRLLSKEFRIYVAGLKGQNINNIDIDNIKSANLTIPIDLDEFTKVSTKKELAFNALFNELEALRS